MRTTLASKQKALRELTRVRIAQEKQIKKNQADADKLFAQIGKKQGVINAIQQQLTLTNQKIADLGAEIQADVNAKNKEW